MNFNLPNFDANTQNTLPTSKLYASRPVKFPKAGVFFIGLSRWVLYQNYDYVVKMKIEKKKEEKKPERCQNCKKKDDTCFVQTNFCKSLVDFFLFSLFFKFGWPSGWSREIKAWKCHCRKIRGVEPVYSLYSVCVHGFSWNLFSFYFIFCPFPLAWIPSVVLLLLMYLNNFFDTSSGGE